MKLTLLLLYLLLPVLARAGFTVTAQTSVAIAHNVRVWPMPPAEPASPDFKVAADGQPVFVCQTHVGSGDDTLRWKAMDDKEHSGDYFALASFASFDLRGPVTIRVTCPNEITQAKILPTSYGLTPQIAGHEIIFSLARPANLTIEVNGQVTSSLHLFANPWETNVPALDDTNVLYFGPGMYEVSNTITVGPGQTLYLAGGAVVRGVGRQGPVVALRGNHVAFRGRGILDGSLCPVHTRHLLSIEADDVTVEGVILRDSSTWNVPLRRSHNVTMTNVKVFGCRANSDGFDICNSTDVTVDGCFLRTLDDLIVVKSDKDQGQVHHVVVKNCVLWNEVAHALSIGAELRENVDDVLFTNCDVIHDIGREWTLRIYHCDSAVISQVRFENIRVEQSRRLISLWINKASWSRDAGRGHIREVTFRDIQAASALPPRIELMGYNVAHAINDVTFDHVVINGRPLASNQVIANPFVNEITVVP